MSCIFNLRDVIGDTLITSDQTSATHTHTRTHWLLAFFMLSPLPSHSSSPPSLFRHEWHSDWLDFFIPQLSVLNGHIKPRTTPGRGKRLRASLWVRPRFSFSSGFWWWLVSPDTAGETRTRYKLQVRPASVGEKDFFSLTCVFVLHEKKIHAWVPCIWDGGTILQRPQCMLH